ncbi:hypothetical protein JKP88DRAFT_241063 [Tribonema minus]|uniref:Helicase ATP-binding domain-containing protein n=1 Tax=Tribonema minus TaxID=303371 RepID=A0A835Z7N2_9STRA|nr:hypothetical protein JKP88DRAFT_241063 [Tribonema minus]
MTNDNVKRSKPQLSWQRVQDIYIKIGHTLNENIKRVYGFFEAPLELLVASGAYLTYREAIQARILGGQKPGYEIGIDGIVIYMIQGLIFYRFLQVKHYANALDCNAIATFMGAITLAREKVELGTSLLCITSTATDLVGRLARPYNYKIVSMSEHQLLSREAEMDETTDAKLPTKSINDLEPRGYQLETVDMVMKAYGDCVPTCIIGHPPGCGKTFTLMLAAEQLFDGLAIRNIILACPGRTAASQAFALFKKYIEDNAEVILVSMDGKTDVEFEHHYDEGEKVKHRLYITTFTSFNAVVDAMTDCMNHDNTVFFVDEAHYPCVEELVVPVIEKNMLVVLVSGTSAYISPYLQCNDEYRCAMLLKEAEDRGLVTTQDYYFPAYLDDTPFADVPKAFAKFAATVFVRRGSNRSLVYCNSIEPARIVVEAIVEELKRLSFTAKFELIIGTTPHSRRAEIIRWIEGGPVSEYRGIVSVQTLNDSFDCPCINGIAIMGIGNHATFIQRVYRGNRTYPGKDSCTIAVFSTPEEIATVFPDTYIERAQRVHCISDDLFEETTQRDTKATTAARASVMKIVEDHVNGVTLLNWNPSCWLPLLKDFIDTHGFKQLKQITKHKGRSLGDWYHRQLSRYRAGQLSDTETAELEEAGVMFATIKFKMVQVSFADKLRIIKQVNEAGVKDTVFNGHNVASWTRHWRSKKDRLTSDQIAALDAIGFEWNPRDALFEAQIRAYRTAKENGVKKGTQEYMFKTNVRRALRGNPLASMRIDRRRYQMLLDAGVIAEGEFPVPARLNECLQRIDAVYPVTVRLPDGSVINEKMHFEECVYDVIKRVVNQYYPERSWNTFELYNSLGEQVYKRDNVKCNTDDVLQLVDVPKLYSRECPSLQYGGEATRLTFLAEGLRTVFTVNRHNSVGYNQRLLSVMFEAMPKQQIWLCNKRILEADDTLKSLRDSDTIYVLDNQ